MDELGLSDSDDLLDAPAPTPFDCKPTDFDGGSDWDSVVVEDVSKTEDQQEQVRFFNFLCDTIIYRTAGAM